jgi:hypothetical protein
MRYDGGDIGMVTLWICFWSIITPFAILALIIPAGMLIGNFLDNDVEKKIKELEDDYNIRANKEE